MTLTHVGKYMPEGVRALGGLLNMLFEAAQACKVSAKMSARREFIGLTLDGGRYSVGVDYADPDKLWFRTRGKIDRDATGRLGVGEILD